MSSMMGDFNPFAGTGYWEGAGKLTGAWLGASMMLASFPATQLDSPLPGPADAAWYYANARNINYLSKQGGMIGEQIDIYLADDVEPSEGTWGNGYVAPSSSSGTRTKFKSSKLPKGSGFNMNFDLFTGTGLDFSNIEFAMSIATQVKAVADEIPGIAMGLQYIDRDSRWPEWDD